MAEEGQMCNCIFCNSKCPECGSKEVEVDFTVRYRFNNDMEDQIFVDMDDSQVSLHCNDCDLDRTHGGVFFDISSGDQDERLQPLYKTLHDHIASSTTKSIEIDQKLHKKGANDGSHRQTED